VRDRRGRDRALPLTSTLLLLDGSVRGAGGNTASALRVARRAAEAAGLAVDEIALSTYVGTIDALLDRVARADALLVGTGTYWSSWGSPLQRFLEVATSLEATDALLGKPVGVVVTMDSVGGVDVAARLLGTFALLGCAQPPFPMVVLSRIGARVQDDDVWSARDVAILVDNLAAMLRAERPAYRRWPVTSADRPSGEWPAWGPLDVGGARFDDDETDR
jgi:NAD(P)H-dependent FMN reductase